LRQVIVSDRNGDDPEDQAGLHPGELHVEGSESIRSPDWKLFD
jgi:hypothetical protein